MYQQIKWAVKNLRLKKRRLKRRLQWIKIRQNQIKTQGVSQLAKNLLNTTEEWERKKNMKGDLKQSKGMQPEPEPKPAPSSSSLSLTQIPSVASVVLSVAGLYYKRKELMALVEKKDKFKKLVKIYKTKRSSILPIQLTTKTQWPRSMLTKKQKQLIYSIFFSKYAPRSLFVDTFVLEKATCRYHTDHNSNSEIYYQNNFVSLLSIN